MSLPDISGFPDAGHADLAEHIADHLEQLADSFLLGQTAADFAQTVLVNFGALQQAVTDQATQIAAQAGQIAELQAQVAALTPLPPAA